jgi:pantothenate kinase
MESASQNEWADNLHTVSIAITRIETAQLRRLSDEFKVREIELRKATGQLETDVSELKDAVEIIRAASEVSKAVANIVKLLA